MAPDVGTEITVSLAQRAASLDPADNRAALGLVGEFVRGVPRPQLVVFPEVFARDFGRAGSDIAAFAETLDGPFVSAVSSEARAHDVTIIAGMFEVSEDPERPYNTLVVVGPDGLAATYRKIHLYDSFGYRESDRLLAGPVDPVVVKIAGVQVGLMTCYDLRFPEASPVHWSTAGPSWWWSRQPGSRAIARSSTGARWSRLGRSRTPCTSPRQVNPAPATPATPWSSLPLARCSPTPTTSTAGWSPPRSGSPHSRRPVGSIRRWPTDDCEPRRPAPGSPPRGRYPAESRAGTP